MTLMTKGEFAVHRGVGKSAVSNYAKKGLLVMGECPTSGAVKVDVERTEARINSRVDPMRGRPSAGLPLAAPVATAEEGGDLLEGRRSTAHVRADLAEETLASMRRKNAREAGELVPAVEMHRRSAELGRVCRERMLSMFRGISERLAVEKDTRTIMTIGIAEINRVFAELADQVEQGMLTADDDAPEDAAIENEVAAAELTEA